MTDRLLPDTSTALEFALEDVIGKPIDSMPVDIRKLYQPYECPEAFLPWLAWATSVDVWDHNWSTEKKRYVIAESLDIHRIKGTKEAIRRYIEFAGGELVEALLPPGGIFAAPALSKDEFDAWIALHPKIRITLAEGTIEDHPDDQGIFSDASFSDYSFDDVNLGPALEGRRAYLVHNGVSTPLQRYDVTVTEGTREGVIHERVVLPGEAGDAMFSDDGFSDVNFVDAVDLEPSVHTYTLRRDYAYREGDLTLSVVPVGFEPMSPRYVRESEVGQDECGVYSDWSFSDDHFVTPDISDELLADVLYLLDRRVPSPELPGVSFSDVDYVGIQHHTAKLLVDPKIPERSGETFSDISFSDDTFSMPADNSRIDFITEAIARAQGLSDEIGVSFGIYRPRTIDDGIPLDGSYPLQGDLVRSHL